MALDIDSILDRRLLRRKLSFWRILALLATAVTIIALLAAAGLFESVGARRDHIARVAINGMITEDRDLLKMLDKIRDDDHVKGVLISMNSPGGTTVGGEAIFEAVRAISSKKPVVTSVGTLAASAGYMIASASDHIVARRSSIVGSIGVIFQYPQAHVLLDRIGVSMREIKSSPLKAEPSPFHEPPPGSEEVIKILIDDSYNWFVDLVTERRPLDRSEVLALADGRIFSGDRGLKNKLVDELGGEETAKTWLVKEKGLDKSLELRDWQPEPKDSGLLFASALMQWISGNYSPSLSEIDPEQLPAIVPKRLFLDGLLSIWNK